MKFKKGDRVLRITSPEKAMFGGLIGASIYPGFVKDVNENVITCEVMVDVARTMKFSKNGAAQNGFIVNAEDIQGALSHGETVFDDHYIKSSRQ